METIAPLFEIVRKLRGEGGCAWDRVQTPESMWKCLAEEMYELEEGIAGNDIENICEELGDVLFQLVFIMEIFQERGEIRFSDIVGRAAEKMIRRHPHVYKDAVVNTKKELDAQWDAIKAEEKKNQGQQRLSVLDRVPKGMPSLIRAMKVSKAVVKEGFDWENMAGILKTVKDEIAEFETALESGDKEEAVLEFGDILFTLVNVARSADFHPETALSFSTAKFEKRYRIMEKELRKKDMILSRLSPDEKEMFWQKAKKTCDRQASD